jgi:hypothetical protein
MGVRAVDLLNLAISYLRGDGYPPSRRGMRRLHVRWQLDMQHSLRSRRRPADKRGG